MSEIAKIILRAIQNRRDPELYGASYALKMNTELAEKAAAEIAALPRSSAETSGQEG